MIGVIIIFYAIAMILLSAAIILNEKEGKDRNVNKVDDVLGLSEQLSPKRLTLKMISMLKSLDYDKAIYFDGLCVTYAGWAMEGLIKSDKVNFNGNILVAVESYYMDVNGLMLLALHYPSIEEDKRVEHFIERLITVGVVKDDPHHTLKKLLKPFIDKRAYRSNQWVSIGDGEYYANTAYTVYRFSDWKSFSSLQALKLIEGLEIKPCEDPEKTHWKHFLELRMKAKKQREKDCSEFIDEILVKQQEYNDLQYKYEMLPSTPITDYESFCNFCKVVKENVIFEDYEITNMLLLKRNNQNLKEEIK